MNTPNTVLTDNLNGTFITYNGNELSLQNDMGNVYTTYLSEGFYPIGLTEFGDIIYIVSIKDSFTEHAYATLIPGADKEATITTIIALGEERLCTFERDDLEKLFEECGMPVYRVYDRNVLDRILWDVPAIASHEFKNIPSKKFEVGSFPSLNPASIEQDDEQELSFEYIYRPFHNLLIKNENGDLEAAEFSTTALTEYDIEHPVSIEVQPSYDGSVNLILTDDKNYVRLINSGFSALENGKGKFTKRNQKVLTNYYEETNVDKTTRLINNSESFTWVELGEYDADKNLKCDGVYPGGSLKGGNYTFYFKFGDEDGNKTDIVCESGIISVFKGTVNNPLGNSVAEPKTVSGAFHNEETDKLIHLTLFDVNQNYSQLHVYYTREYCDLNGYRLVECKEILDPFKIDGSFKNITISGVERTQDISIEELNIAYYTISSAKTIAQQQNMLFLGNITSSTPNNAELQKLSYDIKVSIEQDVSIGSIDVWDYKPNSDGAEYYDPYNIYYKLGYWPDEIYRFGIVYIKPDGTTTQAFNLKGCKFEHITETNMDSPHRKYEGLVTDDMFITGTSDSELDNISGVFKTPDTNILSEGLTRPLYFSFQLDDELIKSLKAQDIVGYFIVRQKRIPITICQGFGVGVDKNTYIPMIKYDNAFYAESFITKSEAADSGRLLKYTPISISGNVVERTPPQDYVYYLYEYTTGHTWFDTVSVSVIGPKGNTPDYQYYRAWTLIFGRSIPQLKQEMIQHCVNYCNNHSISLSSQSPKTTRNYNSIHIDPDDVNHSGSTAEIANKRERKVSTSQEHAGGLLSVDAMVHPELQSMLCGVKFEIDPINKCTLKRNDVMFVGLGYEPASKYTYPSTDAKLIYVPENTPLKYIDNKGFSTQSGDGVNARSFGFLEKSESEYVDSGTSREEIDMLVRGKFTPFIGAITEDIDVVPNMLYNIRVPHSEGYKSEFRVRANDNSEFYAVSNKIRLDAQLKHDDIENVYIKGVNVYRGDCFTNTVTVRMHRNFIDSTAPITDKIVKPDCWLKYYKGYDNTKPVEVNQEREDPEYKYYTYWDEINIADLNTVSLGHWVTYKCLSSYNLGLRSEDTTNVSEMALMGNPRSFYPFIGASTSTGMKLEESHLLNDGYNATVGRKRHTLKQDTPYDKVEYANRIIFSNVNVTDSFMNGYRTFQGASYQDYTKQYGAITKLLPWGNNLFCVFEHGIAIVPINEKALMQTTTDQTIHIYGHGVLPEQLSVISQDFGTLWPESVIRTPIGVYGVDTSAKKIWKYTDDKGLETISDLKLQRFLNDNINLDLTKQPILGTTNVKTHYNNYKGDVMFTFYNDGIEWNLCYNERQALWVTRYSWIPIFSGSINNTYYSIEVDKYDTREEYIKLWKHGRTGVDTQFYPTTWYGVQRPFEFEFVVTEPIGLHKIFEDLMIISNNVQPEEIEFEFIGDDYLFNKARIYHDGFNIYGNSGEDRPYRRDLTSFTKENYDISNFKPLFYNAYVNYDKVLDTHTLVVKQPCKNMETYGRRLGNIQYKEDGWYVNIEPLRFNAKLKDPTATDYSELDKFISTKLRDKWIKIRIKYKGDRLAIINGVTTFENISYS